MKTKNKFINLAKVTFVPAIILNIVVMFLLFGFAISKNEPPEWLNVIGILVLGASIISWGAVSTVTIIKDIGPGIKEDFRQLKGIFKKDK